MRKVRFNKWIPLVRKPLENGSNIQEGTNCWEKDFPNEGVFHQWGCSYEEFEEGAGNFTIAIVELADGTVQSVLPMNLKFITE